MRFIEIPALITEDIEDPSIVDITEPISASISGTTMTIDGGSKVSGEATITLTGDTTVNAFTLQNIRAPSIHKISVKTNKKGNFTYVPNDTVTASSLSTTSKTGSDFEILLISTTGGETYVDFDMADYTSPAVYTSNALTGFDVSELTSTYGATAKLYKPDGTLLSTVSSAASGSTVNFGYSETSPQDVTYTLEVTDDLGRTSRYDLPRKWISYAMETNETPGFQKLALAGNEYTTTTIVPNLTSSSKARVYKKSNHGYLGINFKIQGRNSTNDAWVDIDNTGENENDDESKEFLAFGDYLYHRVWVKPTAKATTTVTSSNVVTLTLSNLTEENLTTSTSFVGLDPYDINESTNTYVFEETTKIGTIPFTVTLDTETYTNAFTATTEGTAYDYVTLAFANPTLSLTTSNVTISSAKLYKDDVLFHTYGTESNVVLRSDQTGTYQAIVNDVYYSNRVTPDFTTTRSVSAPQLEFDGYNRLNLSNITPTSSTLGLPDGTTRDLTTQSNVYIYETGTYTANVQSSDTFAYLSNVVTSQPSQHPTDVGPTLTFDNYNRLAISNITQTSSTLTDPNGSTFNTNTASNVYVTDAGEYKFEARDANTFVMSNVYVGAVSQNLVDVVPTLTFDGYNKLTIENVDSIETATIKKDDVAFATTTTDTIYIRDTGTYTAEVKGSRYGISINSTAPSMVNHINSWIPDTGDYSTSGFRGTLRNPVHDTSAKTYSYYYYWEYNSGNGNYDFRRDNVLVYNYGDRKWYDGRNDYDPVYVMNGNATTYSGTYPTSSDANEQTISLWSGSNRLGVFNNPYYDASWVPPIYGVYAIELSKEVTGTISPHPTDVVPSLTFDNYNKITIENTNYADTTNVTYYSNTYELGTAKTMYVKDAGEYVFKISGTDKYVESNVYVSSVDLAGASTKPIDFDGYNKLTLIDAGSNVSANVTYFSNTYELGSANVLYINGAGTYGLEMSGSNVFALSSNVVDVISTDKFDPDDSNSTYSILGSALSPSTTSDTQYFTSLSNDGTRLLVENATSSYVQVYEYSSGSWTQIGSNINASNEIGTSRISGNGNRICIGFRANNQVKVYEYSSGTWSQIGSTISGSNSFGVSTALNYDGSRLMVGAYGDYNTRGNQTVWEYSGGNWTQLGSTFYCSRNAYPHSLCGGQVDISNDGTVVCAGGYKGHAGDTDRGCLHVWKYDGSSWNESFFTQGGTDHHSHPCRLSGNGKVVYYGHVRWNEPRGRINFYENTSGDTWIQMGGYLEDKKHCDLSYDGKTVVVGKETPIESQIYRFNGSTWVQLGSNLESTGSSVSISSDGSIVATGESLSGTDKISIYKGVTPLPSLTFDTYNKLTLENFTRPTLSDVNSANASVTKVAGGGTSPDASSINSHVVLSNGDKAYHYNYTNDTNLVRNLFDNNTSTKAHGASLSAGEYYEWGYEFVSSKKIGSMTFKNWTQGDTVGNISIYYYDGTTWKSVVNPSASGYDLATEPASYSELEITFDPVTATHFKIWVYVHPQSQNTNAPCLSEWTLKSYREAVLTDPNDVEYTLGQTQNDIYIEETGDYTLEVTNSDQSAVVKKTIGAGQISEPPESYVPSNASTSIPTLITNIPFISGSWSSTLSAERHSDFDYDTRIVYRQMPWPDVSSTYNIMAYDYVTKRWYDEGSSNPSVITDTSTYVSGQTYTSQNPKKVYGWSGPTGLLFEIDNPYYVDYSPPTLTFDNYNKLSINNLTPTSSRLTYGSNTYEIGTASNVYIEHAGTYKMATGDANTFAFVSNVVGTTPTQLLEWSSTEDSILYSNDIDTGDQFGYSVSIDGNYAVIGAAQDSEGASQAGAAYVFYKSNGTWTQQAKLIASDAQASDQFGEYSDISGDYVIVGSPYEDTSVSNRGAAYIFKRSGTSWTQTAKIQGSGTDSGDIFGFSVSIDGDYAIIGSYSYDSPGANAGIAYIFKKDTNAETWTEQDQLQGSDTTAGDSFGSSVYIDGEYAIVGAPAQDTGATDTGAAYIFKKDTNAETWTQTAKIQHSDNNDNASFGVGVSMDGDYCIVGAQNKDSGIGSAYIFKKDTNAETWSQEAKLNASDRESGDSFGSRVSISGNRVIVSSRNEDTGGSNSGAAYIFERSGTDWTEVKKITASDAGADDYFGMSVSIDGTTAFVGAIFNDTKGSNAGAVYVYDKVYRGPELTYDTSNKLSITGITPTATTLTDPNGSSLDIGTATDVYIRDSGKYEIASKDANTFVLASNTVTGTPTGVYSYIVTTYVPYTITTDSLFFNYEAWNYSGTGNWLNQVNTANNQGVFPSSITYNSTSPKSFVFNNSSSERINIGNINLQQTWTLECWAKFYNFSTSRGLFGHGIHSTNEGCPIIVFENGTKTRLAFYQNDVDATFSFQTNTWYHLVYTYNNSGTSRQIYINGVLQTLTTAGNSYGSNYARSTDEFSIGNSYSNGTDGDPMNGEIAVARMYTKVLTEEEIGVNYAAGYLGPTSTQTSTTATTPSQTYDTTKTITVSDVPAGTSTVGKIYKGSTAYPIHATTSSSNVIIENTGSYVSVFTTATQAFLTNTIDVSTPPNTSNEDTTIEDEAPLVTVTETITNSIEITPLTIGIDGLTGWYEANSFNTTTQTWVDLSGNGNDASRTRGTVSKNETGLNGLPIIYGGTGDGGIEFPADAMGGAPTTYTIFTVAKYGSNYNTSGTKGRIFNGYNNSSQGNNWLSGFWYYSNQGGAGMAFHGAWITDTSDIHGYNWVLGTSQHSMYRSNGTDRSNDTNGGAGPTYFFINSSNESTTWSVAEVILYKGKNLTSEEYTKVEEYLNGKYDITTDVQKNSTITTTTTTSTTTDGLAGSTAVPDETATVTDTPSATLDATDTTVTEPTLNLDFTTTLPRTLKRYNGLSNSSIGARFNRRETKKKRIEKSISIPSSFSAELTANNASSPTTLTVTVANSKFVINGDETPTLAFIRGETYTFDQSDASNSGHPLVLATSEDGTQYTTGWTASGTPGTDGSHAFIVPYDVPDTIYYKCTNHPNMGGEINTTFGNVFSLGDFTVAANTHVSGEYTLATNYDGTTSNLYVNGFLITQTTPSPVISAGVKEFILGKEFDGYVKNFKFWNYAKDLNMNWTTTPVQYLTFIPGYYFPDTESNWIYSLVSGSWGGDLVYGLRNGENGNYEPDNRRIRFRSGENPKTWDITNAGFWETTLITEGYYVLGIYSNGTFFKFLSPYYF